MWWAEQLLGDPGRFTIGEVIELDGPIDPVRFEQALRFVLRETEVGLVRFVERDGELRQVLDLDRPWTLDVVDLRGVDDPGAAIDEVAAS